MSNRMITCDMCGKQVVEILTFLRHVGVALHIPSLKFDRPACFLLPGLCRRGGPVASDNAAPRVAPWQIIQPPISRRSIALRHSSGLSETRFANSR